MRKLIVTNIMSLDGYYTGPDDNIMVMPMDGRFDEYNAERAATADILLLGRTSYEGFSSFWPPVAEDSSASAANRALSRRQLAMHKVAVSDTLELDPANPWTPTAEVVSRDRAYDRIAELKRESADGDILVFGSHTLWTDLLAHGLVDELHLMLGAAVVGGGVPMFDRAVPAGLTLIETRTWDDSSNVLLRYAVA
jgi:dihydrofolate reductase